MVTKPNHRRRPELAAFLRSRRARVTPADVGMPPGLRRRTPGLRREEVAQLSGVGVTWYTWLEQGRPINASAQVLDAVARTLRLDTAERMHLYHLAEVPYEEDPDGEPPFCELPAEVQGIIDALNPLPAAVYSSRYDVLAANASYAHLFPSFHLRQNRRNVLWSLFTGPSCCCVMINRDTELPVLVATLRGAYGPHVGEPAWEEFIRDLCGESSDFRALWESGDVAPAGARIKVVQHASVGQLECVTTSLAVSGIPETRIVVYTPHGEDSQSKMRKLMSLDDPLIGCPYHARPLSEALAVQAETAITA
ncbi:helix-turn-helix domain-containing protein [Streptomyces sp. A7024]|uniref:Helix-turn-helix domain-containing protein n=1 Tax=Streptomyces coryli TaxID=1128680 RepID=A0A6G4UCQ5_9ACTN|nr:helix-turn-helix transcriptional regulator [Streptomyces coryli]NGN69999.1 helix-turn-helix domain-containing protein [Streptomyces coryli]